MRTYVLGTRGSPLALCQARMVQTLLEERAPGCSIELKTLKAQADRNPELPLAAMAGEGVFVKELEAALLARRVDVAVHSLKDVPLETPAGLWIAAVLAREEPRDALISRERQGFEALPRGARIGTSSVRRGSQLLHHRPDLSVLEIRGNVDTRLRKLQEGRYDAIVVAACGLIRLGLEERITEVFDLSVMLPEPGQGALAIEARADDREVLELVGRLDDPISRACVEAERACLKALGGGCRVPIAAFGEASQGVLRLHAAVLSPDGRQRIEAQGTGQLTKPVRLGQDVAARLAKDGAAAVLAKTR